MPPAQAAEGRAHLQPRCSPATNGAKALTQSGISQVIYYEDKYADSDSVIASKRMFDMVGIRYTPYKRTGRGVELAL